MKNSRTLHKALIGIATIVFLCALGVFLCAGKNFVLVKSIFRSDITRDELREILKDFGVRGILTVSIFSAMQVVLTFLPAEPVQVVAGMGYGVLRGGLICLAGVAVGNTVIFILYKIFGGKLTEYFNSKLDTNISPASKNKFVFIIFSLYFLPAIPYGLICFLTASINTKYPKYILLTTLGSIPSIIIGVGLGHMVVTTSFIISICVFVVLIILIALLFIFRDKFFDKLNAYLKRQATPYSDKTKVRKPDKLFCSFISLILTVFIRSKIKVIVRNKSKKIKGPALILINHGSFYDFAYAHLTTKGNIPHFIVARMFFYGKFLGSKIKRVGSFPKSLYETDIECAQNSLKVIKSNELLAMMPEARLSTAGHYDGMQENTYKFIKRLGVPVYLIKIYGSYLACPKWGDGLRKGSVVETSFSQIFTENELEEMSDEQVKRKIDESIDYDDFEWLKTQPKVKYKCKTIAEGLENVLFMCPACRKKLTLKTQKNEIFCTECGFKTKIDDRYAFIDRKPFENFAEWYRWQKEEYKKEVESTSNYRLESKVLLKHSSTDGKTQLRDAGDGVCVLDKNGLRYDGTSDGNGVTKIFPIEKIYRIPFGAGEDFELYDGREIWYFVPPDKRECVMWYILSEFFAEKYNKA